MRKTLAFMALAVLLLGLATRGTARALPAAVGPAPMLPEPQVPGRVEGTGTHFAITGSQYLNVTLDSSQLIKVVFESVPQMLILRLEAAAGAAAAEITLCGFAPSTQYHMYQDSYDHHTPFTTDGSGRYIYTQDLSQPHLVFVQPRASTIHISDSGWNPSGVGTWDAATRTATLAQDVTETIEIDSDNLTLEGNGHTVSGNHTGLGVTLGGRTGVTVRNLTVQQFSSGFYIHGGGGNSLTGNTVTNNMDGIEVRLSGGNTLTGNVASNNAEGIYLELADGNTLTGNTASSNTRSGIFLYASGSTTMIGNTMAGNGYNFYLYGSTDAHHDNSVDETNLVDGKPIYYLKGASGQTFNSSTNTGAIYLVNCSNITVAGLALSHNGAGVYLWNTSSSRIENIQASSNDRGIYLGFSNGNTLTGNTADSSDAYGIQLRASNNNTLTGNTTSNGNCGIFLDVSNNNTLSGNAANANETHGIVLLTSSGNSLTSNSTSNNHYTGIGLNNSDNNALAGNIANSNESEGITLANSSGNTMAGNAMAGNGWNYYLLATTDADHDNTVDTTNLVDGKPIYYIKGTSGQTYGSSTNAGAIYLVNCSNITVTGLTFSHNGAGVYLWETDDSRIENVQASSSAVGIYLGSSSGNTLTGNTTQSNLWGIHLEGSSGNTLAGNGVNANTSCGIILNDAGSNVVAGNTLTANQNGLYVLSAGGNQVYNNNFIGSIVDQALDETGCAFNLAAPTGGNYWSNWTGPDVNGDGFVDSPYVFTGGQDNLPWTTQDAWLHPADSTPPTTTLSLSGTTGNNGWYRSDVQVTLSATDEAGGTGVKSTEYSLDGASWTTYSAPFTLSGEGTTTVYYRSTDNGDNVEAANSRTIKIDKTPPTVTITTPQPYAVLPLGSTLAFSATDTVSGLAGDPVGTLTDGTTTTNVASGTQPGAGAYTLQVSATDAAGNTTPPEPVSFVVYDALGGSVSGAGWIDSPAGAYTADPNLAGRATFGFVSKYGKGATAPTGDTRFQLRVAGLSFHSCSYDWLVVAGTRAQFKGTGTINGLGDYGFLLTAVDGRIKGSSSPDKFRIQIRDKTTDTLVYDNQMGAADNAEPTAAIGGGSIVVHQ